MAEFQGIDGVKGGTIPCLTASSISGALRLLTKKSGVIAAGSEGSISLWICDNGDYRADFSRYLRTVDSQTFHKKHYLEEWIKKWWPVMGDREKLAEVLA